MSRKAKILLGSLAYWLLMATPVFGWENPLKWDNICDAMSGIVSVIFVLAAGIAVVLLVIGGIQYMTSGGDKVAVEAARGRITSAVVGLAITLGAYLIVWTILKGVTNYTELCTSPG